MARTQQKPQMAQCRVFSWGSKQTNYAKYGDANYFVNTKSHAAKNLCSQGTRCWKFFWLRQLFPTPETDF